MTTQLQLDAIDGTAPLRGEPVFMGFTPDTDDAEAVRMFRERHGRDPLGQERNGGALLLVIEWEKSECA